VFKQPELLALDEAIETERSALYVAWLEEGVRVKEIRQDLDIQLAVKIIFDLWSATLRRWVEDDQNFSLAGELVIKFELLFKGISAK
jgi:hypothetical protein